MGYYMAGDYYSRGGIGSFLKGAVRTVAGAAIGLATGGPLAAARNVVSSISPTRSNIVSSSPGFQIPQINVNPMAALPGGAPLFSLGGRRRRRMNFANGRALNRANRRVDGFVRMARRSLKHTGYKIVSKHAGKGKRVSISESGPGSVNVRG